MHAIAQRNPDRAVLLIRQDSLCDIARRSNALHCPSESSWTTNGSTSAIARREALQCPSRPASRRRGPEYPKGMGQSRGEKAPGGHPLGDHWQVPKENVVIEPIKRLSIQKANTRLMKRMKICASFEAHRVNREHCQDARYQPPSGIFPGRHWRPPSAI